MTDKTGGRFRSRALRIAVEVGVIVLVLLAIRAWQHRDVASDTAPALAGTTLNGAPFDLSAAPERPILVHFWATWCSICKLEQGSIDALARDYPVITVAMQSGTEAEVIRHLGENGLSFAAINDPGGDIARRWGVRAVPASFIVDARGKVRFVEVGYTTELGLRARLRMARSRQPVGQ
jgi:thiol-disulfide isomerase/thioredoxin